MSRCLAKISTWMRRSWLKLSPSKTAVMFMDRRKSSKERCGPLGGRTHVRRSSRELALGRTFRLLADTALSCSNSCEGCFPPSLSRQESTLTPGDEDLAFLAMNAFLASHLEYSNTDAAPRGRQPAQDAAARFPGHGRSGGRTSWKSNSIKYPALIFKELRGLGPDYQRRCPHHSNGMPMPGESQACSLTKT